MTQLQFVDGFPGLDVLRFRLVRSEWLHQQRYRAYGNQQLGILVSFLVPDGRTQTISYTTDDYLDYVFKVTYSGEAKNLEYKAGAYPIPAYSVRCVPFDIIIH